MQHGTVAGYRNCCKYCKDRCNVQYVFSPILPPWFKEGGKSPNVAKFGYIYVEIVHDIKEGSEIPTDYDFQPK